MESEKTNHYRIVGSVDRDKLFILDDKGNKQPVVEAVKIIELVTDKK